MDTVLPLYAREEDQSHQCLLDSAAYSTTVTTLSSTPCGTQSVGAVYGAISLKPRADVEEPDIESGDVGQDKYKTVLGLARKVSDGYLGALEKWPIRTKCMTYCALTLVADAFAQLLSGGGGHYDWYRTGCMMLIATVFTAPLYHFMYELLEERFPTTRPLHVAVHVMTDQLVIAPTWSLGYLTLLALLQHGCSWAAVCATVGQSFLTVVWMSWVVFPLVQVLNFSYVPKRMRVMVVASVGVLYNMVVSMATHRG